MKKKKYKIKWKNLFILLLFIVMVIVFFVSLINILVWQKDSNNTNEELKEINNVVTIIEKNDNENTEITPQKEEIPKSNPYWDYIKMNLMDVDFAELMHKNSDTKGWISVNGTNINYPYVQTTDNEFYLDHSFNKKYNKAGWVFMDYRNNPDEFDKNTLLYAHGRVDKTMFGSLKNILNSDWINDTNNYVIKLSTQKENTIWQVFSIYNIPETSDYLKIDFSTTEEFMEFGNMLLSRSQYNFNTSINEEDKILSLSTCYNDANRIVLHAKLIKKELKY